MDMELTPDIKYTEELLREAMELLESTYANLGMFQRQRYGHLKKRFEQHGALTEGLRTALNDIDTQ